VILLAIAMDHDQDPQRGAQTEQDEPLLGVGVVGVIEQQGLLIAEDRLGLGEGDAMLTLVRGVLGRVPLEAEVAHLGMYVRCTYIARLAGAPNAIAHQLRAAARHIRI